MFKFFTDNKSISPNQSGLKTRGPCINQLFSVTFINLLMMAMSKWCDMPFRSTLHITTKHYIYNHGQNILRLFNTLPNFLFTTSETKRDY